MSRLTDVVKHLIIINVIAYFAVQMLSVNYEDTMNMGPMFFFKSPLFQPFQVVTSMFMHGGHFHLLMNMLGLFFLGPTVERVLGSKRFFILYFAAGLGASLLHQLYGLYQLQGISSDSDAYYYLMTVPVLGASGAIYGVVIAFMTMFPNEKLMIIPIPIPIPAKVLGSLMVLAAIYFGITDNEPGGYAHFAHLGGAIVGFLMIHYWKMANLR